MPTIRLIPIVLFATASLFVLKTAALMQGGGYTFGALNGARAEDATTAPARRSWAQEMLGYPDVTGSVPSSKPADPPAPPAEKPEPPKKGQPSTADKIGIPGRIVVEGAGAPTSGERAVIENLQERRQQLEARASELEIREGLVKAAEKRLEARLQELKAAEAQITAAMQKKDEAEAERFKSLVVMYENMKPKDAARIFDRLEMRILLDVAGEIAPRKMSDILAQMSGEAAERLTVELAARANASRADGKGKQVNPLDLPKIEGRPRS